jgi:pyruvate carboxylase
VHTHDTAGNGVAAMIAAAEAGADVVDVATDSMSGVTSQPCMGAIVSALENSALDTGIRFDDVQLLNGYWEQVRLLYKCFDPQVNSPSSEVYVHEMPGGQYTNLLFQASSLGLGSQWTEIKKAYVVANRLCGDIIKVTPSSKVVGDFAQFIVSNKLSEQDVLDKAETLSFPKSVVEYFQGYLGIPPYGFPEPLRTKIVRNLPRIDDRPGKSLPAMDMKKLKIDLENQFGPLADYDISSAALYPAVCTDIFADDIMFYLHVGICGFPENVPEIW